MSAVKRNVVAGIGGTVWSSLVGLVFVPIYIRFLGMEAYGLIGVFATVQALAVLLDGGLSTTLNRELARLSGQRADGDEMRDLVRTLAAVYWGAAILLAVGFASLAPVLTLRWIKAGHLSAGEVEASLALMGLSFALQWPAGLYMGGLQGLQRHVRLNAIIGTLAAVRGVGGVFVLWGVSRTLHAFFMWQSVASALLSLVLAWALWRALPPGSRHARFAWQQLRRVGRFAGGMTGITVLVLILTQVDKVILSKLLPLESFGYYVLAGTVAAVIARIVAPVFSAIFPRFSELVGRRDEAGLRQLYHRACQLVSVLVLPASVVLALFSGEVLRLWTRDASIADHAHVLVSVLVIGTALNALMNIPYALQLAHGWTRLAVYQNVVAVVVLIPLIIVAALRWGALGGAFGWLALNAGYVVITMPVMHRRLLRGELRHWYVADVGRPLAAALFVAGIGRLAFPRGLSLLAEMLYLGAVSAATLAAAAWSLPWIRARVARQGLRLQVTYD